MQASKVVRSADQTLLLREGEYGCLSLFAGIAALDQWIKKVCWDGRRITGQLMEDSSLENLWIPSVLMSSSSVIHTINMHLNGEKMLKPSTHGFYSLLKTLPIPLDYLEYGSTVQHNTLLLLVSMLPAYSFQLAEYKVWLCPPFLKKYPSIILFTQASQFIRLWDNYHSPYSILKFIRLRATKPSRTKQRSHHHTPLSLVDSK